MNCVRISIATLLAFSAVAEADNASPAHSLELAASTPQVDVSRRPTARNYLRLPTLDYTFRVIARCTGDFKPQSVSLSIADSRRSLSQAQLNDAGKNAELTVKVPANQLAPLVIENFCVDSTDDRNSDSTKFTPFPGVSKITVAAALSAQAALLCRDEEQQEMIYKSHPLDITLVCSAPEEELESVPEQIVIDSDDRTESNRR